MPENNTYTRMITVLCTIDPNKRIIMYLKNDTNNNKKKPPTAFFPQLIQNSEVTSLDEGVY